MLGVKNTRQKLVSVVTPFYNSEKYLIECIESVLNQTHTHFEYLLVNNCSTDFSYDIARKYAESDNRIKLITNDKFFTQVQNYNNALCMISPQSEYCKMAQADDWLFPDCLEKMVEIAHHHPSIGIVSSYCLKGEQVIANGLPYPSTFVPGREICRRQLLKNLSVFGSPSSVLYRADIVRKRYPFFSEGRYFEDTEACFEILENDDFGFVHQILSFTRTENDSITKSVSHFNPGKIDRFIQVHRYGQVFLNSEEFRSCLGNARKDYFTFLAESVFTCKGKRFWEYHKKGLEAINIKLTWRLLIFYFLWELVDIVFNPKKTAIRVWRRLWS